jgi:hypothetical protein
MKHIYILGLILFSICSNAETIKIDKATLFDKIKGGWAGQAIGVCYGAEVEFKFLGKIIEESVEIEFNDSTIYKYFDSFPGLFDDIYMDLIFVDVIAKYGYKAKQVYFEQALANSEFPLWHANQAARYNLQNGLKSPNSGFWKNNPHADDIDFQIEADFAGLLAPANPNLAIDLADRVGHIMNSGDGWYGGVFVSLMYAYAFKEIEIKQLINEALKPIPEQSTFRQCIGDVVKWHQQYPKDWKKTWRKIQNKWAYEKGCPNGVRNDLNIDAKINAAYVVLGLLYGEMDFFRTMDITTRCGQDADCNPATAIGVLSTLIGYSNIPIEYKLAVELAENRKFINTDLSLTNVYNLNYNLVLNKKENYSIDIKTPKQLRLEQNFENLNEKGFQVINKNINKDNSVFELEIEAKAFVIRGGCFSSDQNTRAVANLYIDGKFVEKANFPVDKLKMRTDIFWNYELSEGKHKIRVEFLEGEEVYIQLNDILLYD